MSKIRVALIEDHDLTRIGLLKALESQDTIQVIGQASDGQQGLELIQRLQPDVVILDIGLPDIDGIEVTRRCREQATQPKILILTMHDSEDAVLAAFAAGADSYSVKDVKIERLVEAIQATHDGNAWIDPVIARIVLGQTTKSLQGEGQGEKESDRQTVINAVSPHYEQIIEADPLTARELEVLELIVAGYDNATIAEHLTISVGTVKTHVRNILNKLCASDRTQAAVRALRSGLVS